MLSNFSTRTYHHSIHAGADLVAYQKAWGAPPKLVALIKDLHTHHAAVNRSEIDSAPVGTSGGYKQGCVLAPPLFNVCLDSIICQLLPQLPQLGVTICYKIDGHLMHCKKPTEEVLMCVRMYAENISLACDTIEKLRVAVTTMDATLPRWGTYN
ncbi:MAG: hypothetical protein FRX49_13739 [Trebouxia sp. A1-2]|nr:MAG: hypothetical protein FRX49_13739 [Trebouxia sp. A1-2]